MPFLPTITALLVLFQSLSVKGFLLNTNQPPSLDSPEPNGTITISNLSEKVDRLQLQMLEQNKSIEEQNVVIQQLLNLTKESPSASGFRNALSILQMYVRILSNILETTDISLNINSMVDSFNTLTTSLRTPKNKMTQMENDLYQFRQEIDKLNGTLNSVVQQTKSHALNQAISTQSLQNELSVLEMKIQQISEEQERLQHIVNTTYLAQRISSMANTVKDISLSLIDHENKIAVLNETLSNTSHSLQQLYHNGNAISSIQQSVVTLSSRMLTTDHRLTTITDELQAAKNDIGIIQENFFENQQNMSDNLMSLSAKNQNEISTLTNNLNSCESRVSSMENNVSRNQQNILSMNIEYSSISQTFFMLTANVSNMDLRIQPLEDFYDFAS